jgi:signal peptidase I
MMARHSKTRDNTPRAVVAGSPTRPGPTTPAARTGSKGAAVAKLLRRIISTVVVLAVLAAVGVVTVTLIEGTWQVNPVVSGSMRPGFTVGGVVISERIPVDRLVLRDVIVFRNPTNPADLIVHRIVAMTKSKSGQREIKTQGDANDARDSWTLTIQGNYAYVVRWSLPLLGYVALAYQNNHGLLLLGAGIVLIAAAATAILKQRRRDEEPDASGDSESSESLDSAVTSPASPIEDVAVTSSAARIDTQAMESSSQSLVESGPPIDSPSPQKISRRRRFGMKRD